MNTPGHAQAEMLAKLPKWAQQHIRQLEAAVDQLHERIQITDGDGLPDSDTWVDPKQVGVKRIGLGDQPTITFNLGGSDVEARIQKETGRPDYWLNITVVDLGPRLSVTPIATNAIQVRPTK